MISKGNDENLSVCEAIFHESKVDLTGYQFHLHIMVRLHILNWVKTEASNSFVFKISAFYKSSNCLSRGSQLIFDPQISFFRCFDDVICCEVNLRAK